MSKLTYKQPCLDGIDDEDLKPMREAMEEEVKRVAHTTYDVVDAAVTQFLQKNGRYPEYAWVTTKFEGLKFTATAFVSDVRPKAPPGQTMGVWVVGELNRRTPVEVM